jgi:molybdate transport system substrate-binding protein
MSRIFAGFMLFCLLAITGCSQAQTTSVPTTPEPPTLEASATLPSLQGELTVFAAASLADGFEDLKSAFQQEHPGVSFVFNFAGSQQLAQQLAQGAKADLFASADLAQMEAAISTGSIDPEEVSAMIGNSLIVITPVDNPGQIVSPVDLAKPGLKLILADKAVPAGAYALEFLERASTQPDFGADFKEKVMDNVVSFEEDIRAVVDKIILGEADAGIVYLSDALKAGPTQVDFIQIPQEINPSVTYYITPIKDSNQAELARRFQEFILSEQGQSILSRRGFIPVQ